MYSCNTVLTAHDGTAYSQCLCDRVDHATPLEDLHILSMMTVQAYWVPSLKVMSHLYLYLKGVSHYCLVLVSLKVNAVYIRPDGKTLIGEGQWLFLSTRRVAG